MMNTKILEHVNQQLSIVEKNILECQKMQNENPVGFFRWKTIPFQNLLNRKIFLNSLIWLLRDDFTIEAAENYLGFVYSNLFNFEIEHTTSTLQDAENEIKLSLIKFKIKTLLECCMIADIESPIINFLRSNSNL